MTGTTTVLSDHEYCKRFLNDVPLFERTVSLLQRGWLSERETNRLRKPELTQKYRYKILEAAVIRQLGALQAVDFLGSSVLEQLARIYLRNVSIRAGLLEGGTMRGVFEWAGLPLGHSLNLNRVSEYSRSNICILVSSDSHRYFVRYHDPLGFEFFARSAPAVNTYVYRLCEEVVRHLLGADHVINTIYPSLHLARKHLEKEEGSSDVYPIVGRVLIQPDLSQTHFVLADYDREGIGWEPAVRLFANLLGTFHGASFGVSRAFARRGVQTRTWKRSEKQKILRLLSANAEMIRFSSAKQYSEWLREPNWVTLMFLVIARSENPVFRRVAEAVSRRGTDLATVWGALQRESVAAMDVAGSLGHLDFKMNNLFVDRSDMNRARMYDFDYLTFIDPMYESGHSIYSLVKLLLIREHLQTPEELKVIVAVYMKEYLRAFEQALESNGGDDDRNYGRHAYARRSCAFGGITLLSVFATEWLEYGISAKQLSAVEELCLDLLTSPECLS